VIKIGFLYIKGEKGQVVMNSDQSMSVAIAGSPLPSETSCDQEVASFRISDLDWTSCFYCIVKKNTCGLGMIPLLLSELNFLLQKNELSSEDLTQRT